MRVLVQSLARQIDYKLETLLWQQSLRRKCLAQFDLNEMLEYNDDLMKAINITFSASIKASERRSLW